MRARALVLVVLLLSYGAVSARQPAVRVLAPLPVPARTIADALEIATIDRSQLLVNIIRTSYALGARDTPSGPRAKLSEAIAAAGAERGELVPLPLDPSIWRETILQQKVPDEAIVGAILQDRAAALLYHGLAGLDDETLAWIGPERDTLQVLMRHAGAFAAFGPSVRVRAGRIAVPGGAAFEDAWQAAIGADPARPASFIRKLFGDDGGQVAWFYDAVAQLDDASFRFAVGTSASASAEVRSQRMRALFAAFQQSGNERRVEAQPFNRRTFDPALTLMLVRVTAEGDLAGIADRGFWDRVFDDEDRPFTATPPVTTGDTGTVDSVWLVSRVHKAPIDIGRRRLDAFLFGQRVLEPSGGPASVEQAAAIRGYLAFPALMLTLERAGIRSPRLMSAAAARADALGKISDERRQRIAVLQFQAMLGIVDRMSRSRGIAPDLTASLVSRLVAVETTNHGYEGRLAAWIRSDLVPALPPPGDDRDPIEGALLAAMAGRSTTEPRLADWEGRAYRVSAARGEAIRLHRVRERQGGTTLSQALERFDSKEAKGAVDRESVLADTLSSILYAAYLGDPEGPALGGGNIALRHELGSAGAGSRSAWRLPTEGHSGRGWRVSGSLLGLDVALARMALRRLDFNVMPPEPKLVSAERQTAALSVALLNAASLRDADRDEIAAALARGRARLAALDGSRTEIERAASDAGLSAWRREALAWTASNDREHLDAQLSPLETMWLGQPRATVAGALDDWGAAMLPLSGCLCLAMPQPRPWEPLTGRPSLGLLATRGADVAILVAVALSESRLPAELAPGVIAFAMQEVVDQARPSYMDDWSEFTRAARAMSRDTLADFIAAQAAVGGLLPSKGSENRHP
jgi:hypothetical protein